MEKNKLLKVTSILFIIFGALGTFFSLLVLILMDALIQIMLEMAEYAQMGATALRAAVLLIFVILLVECAAYIAAGIIGVRQKSAKTCFIVAIIVMVVCGVSALYQLIGGNIISLIALVLPILYLIGAIQYKKESDIAEKEDEALQ